MNLSMSIASNSAAMSSASLMLNMNTALLGKVLDTAQIQGEGIQDMMEAVPSPAPNTGRLDVYA